LWWQFASRNVLPAFNLMSISEFLWRSLATRWKKCLFHVQFQGVSLICSQNWASITQVERSTCVPYEHHDRSYRVTIPYAACIQCDLLRMNVVLLETCRGL
jgi:hypothetical protein